MRNVDLLECEICGNNNLQPILDLGSHPMCDDLVPIDSSSQSSMYPIEIMYCANCVTAHQKYHIPARKLFPHSYHYRPRFTADVLEGMEALVEACERELGTPLSEKVVLDVGCNDASLLNIFKQKGAKTIGIEPTAAYLDGLNSGHTIYNHFFNQEVATQVLDQHGFPDVITFTNVFAHIENLSGLLDSLKVLISSDTLIVIENHYLGSILEQNQFDTFYHEHIRTYSLTSFTFIAERIELSLTNVQFPTRYGGNIRVFLGGTRYKNMDDQLIEQLLEPESNFGHRLSLLQANVDYWKNIMLKRIKDLVIEHGPMSAKAFPGRAAILLRMLDIDVDSIKVVYEKPSSKKNGHYVPGTRIPIRSEHELFNADPAPAVIVNLAWHISDEIRNYLRDHQYFGKVIDILDPRDLPK